MPAARPPERRTPPTDPDVDLSEPDQRQEMQGRRFAVIGVIALGGILGALARYQIGRWWPTAADGFPAATLAINLFGCLVIGVFMVLITDVFLPHRLLRPFVGTGVLGGFTTFSTYAIDIQSLISRGHSAVALVYLAVTAIGAVLAVGAGMSLTRWISRSAGPKRLAAADGP